MAAETEEGKELAVVLDERKGTAYRAFVENWESVDVSSDKNSDGDCGADTT